MPHDYIPKRHRYPDYELTSEELRSGKWQHELHAERRQRLLENDLMEVKITMPIQHYWLLVGYARRCDVRLTDFLGAELRPHIDQIVQRCDEELLTMERPDIDLDEALERSLKNGGDI